MSKPTQAVHEFEHHTTDRKTTRPVVSGTQGIVTGGHPLVVPGAPADVGSRECRRELDGRRSGGGSQSGDQPQAGGPARILPGGDSGIGKLVEVTPCSSRVRYHRAAVS